MVFPWVKRKRAYERLFPVDGGVVVGDAREVLADLQSFCGGLRAPFTHDGAGRLDPIATARHAGRREVYDRIMAQIHLPIRSQHDLNEVNDD